MAFQPPIIIGPSGRGQKQQLTSGGWQVITKTADESRNTSTKSIDSQLQINVAAGSKYRVRIMAFVFCSANGVNSRVNVTGPTMSLLIGQQYGTDNASGFSITSPTIWTPSPHTAYPADRLQNVSANEYIYWYLDLVVIPSASGLFGLSWAQSVNNAGQTCTVSRGSTLEYVAF